MLVYDFLLKYFFISIELEQKSQLDDMIKELVSQKEEQSELRNIFQNFDFLASKPVAP